jgi:hypothetical protein
MNKFALRMSELTDASAPPPANPIDAPVTGDFLSSLSEDLRAEPSLANFKDINSLAKSYASAQKMIGADKIVIPGKYATPDEWKQVYSKLGLPESADKYEYKFGENKAVSDEFVKEFTLNAHKNGVLPHQAQEMLSYIDQLTSSSLSKAQEDQKAQIAGALSNLRSEWGNTYDQEINYAKSGLKAFADEDTLKFLDSSGLGDNPAIIKLFNKIGKAIGEDKFQKGGVVQDKLTPELARREVNKVMGDHKHAYYDANHPAHKDAVTDMQKYYEVMASANA